VTKFLQVIYYTHSTEQTTLFRAGCRSTGRNICGRCLTKSMEGAQVPKATEDKFKLAADLS
jgi:hypothetical protein